MANTHTGDTAWAFRDEDFTLEDYPDNYPHNFFDLENENLFPRSRFPMLCRETAAANNAFSAIEPGLFLCSRILLQNWKSVQLFVRRQNDGHNEKWLNSSDELQLSRDEVISQIKTVAPEIEFDPDMKPNSSSFADNSSPECCIGFDRLGL